MFLRLFLLCCFIALPVKAETIRIQSVEAGPVLITTNGERLRLANLRTPDEPSILPLLTTALLNKDFVVKRSPRANRWNEVTAQLTPDPRPELLQQGLAQLSLSDAALSAAEASAMAAQKGLWARPCCRLLTAEEAAQQHDVWRVVQGTVKDVTARGQTTYVNFGTDWRTDFTLSLSATLARRSNAASLIGQTVIVRGWITLRGGGLMTIRTPAQIKATQSHLPDAPKPD